MTQIKQLQYLGGKGCFKEKIPEGMWCLNLRACHEV